MAMRKKPITAKGLKRVPAMFAKIEISIDTRVANTKLEAGRNNMLAMIIGIVKTNKLRPEASSNGVSVK